MTAGCIAVSKRALIQSLLVAGFSLAAISAPAGAQTMSVDQLMRQLEGKPIADQPTPAAAAKSKIFRSRSFSAKETDPVPEQAAAAAPQQAQSQAQVAVQHPEVDLEIYFTPASAKITKQAMPDLEVIGRALSHEKFSNAKFRIAGHTDGVGGAAYNLELSKKRAQAVRSFLISRYKISAARIEAVGFGKEKLKVADDVASPRNRRVQIVNLSASK